MGLSDIICILEALAVLHPHMNLQLRRATCMREINGKALAVKGFFLIFCCVS